MATDPGAPSPDIDRPDVAPAETPVREEPSQPGVPEAPDEMPNDAPATDVPDQGPIEMPPPMGHDENASPRQVHGAERRSGAQARVIARPAPLAAATAR